MRIVFMGTPEFAVPCLDALIEQKHEIAAVVTQPDRGVERGKKLPPPPVKALAEKSGIIVHQQDKVKSAEFVQTLKDLKPDVIVVVAYGQLLSQEILDIPPFGCINVHASLLPKYRGAAPINWCIINGEKVTGVTTMYMDRGMDTGDMILKREIEIGENETASELHDRLMALGAAVLKETMELIEAKSAPRTPQNSNEATYAAIMNKGLGRIDWSKSAIEIKNLIRGTYPWPGAYSTYNGKVFKIFAAEIADNDTPNGDPGCISIVGKDSITITCGKGSLKISELQFQNEKRMAVEAYLRGHEILEGTILGK